MISQASWRLKPYPSGVSVGLWRKKAAPQFQFVTHWTKRIPYAHPAAEHDTQSFSLNWEVRRMQRKAKHPEEHKNIWTKKSVAIGFPYLQWSVANVVCRNKPVIPILIPCNSCDFCQTELPKPVFSSYHHDRGKCQRVMPTPTWLMTWSCNWDY